ncbi:MAG: ATP-binding cassette subfamily F protein uup [Halocynthiibacter sp.]|jgi:ATP-binding cassette subfamily F protein uup
MEGDGKATLYPGGWSDYRDQRSADAIEKTAAKSKGNGAKLKQETGAKGAADTGLTYTEQHRLETLPADMERLEAEIAKLVEFLSDPELFTAHPAKFQKATDALIERQAALDAAEEEWMALEERAS